MHKIKFRGKRLDNGEWVYGWYFEPPIGQEFLGKSWITPYDDKSILRKNHNVDPETVGQYINLKANDIEIYAGTIIDQFDHRFVVESCPGGYDLGVYYKNRLCCGRQGTYTISALDTNSFYCQVVGNIHDNPELLEG